MNIFICLGALLFGMALAGLILLLLTTPPAASLRDSRDEPEETSRDEPEETSRDEPEETSR